MKEMEIGLWFLWSSCRSLLCEVIVRIDGGTSKLSPLAHDDNRHLWLWTVCGIFHRESPIDGW